MDVFVALHECGRIVRDRREALLDVRELIRVEEAGAVQPRRVLGRRRAVVREELRVVRTEQLPHGGVELPADTA